MIIVPESMQVVELRQYSEDNVQLSISTRKVPIPVSGQVLVKIAASPINPSDLSFLAGNYGIKKKLPTVPGFEASGMVVASGGGVLGAYLRGKRVACAAMPDLDGSWAEYMLTSAAQCIPLRRSVELEQGAMLIVNPLTAFAMLEIARSGGARAIIQNAAAGALGRMIHRLATRQGIKVINIVRRTEQVDILKSAGIEHVLDSSSARFQRDLTVQARRLQAIFAMDAIGGAQTAILASAMPDGSQLLVYGGLAGEECRVHPGSLIFQEQTVRGFWLSKWLEQKSPLKILHMAGALQKMLATEMRSEVAGRYSLEQAGEALQNYASNMSAGKVLMIPGYQP